MKQEAVMLQIAEEGMADYYKELITGDKKQ